MYQKLFVKSHSTSYDDIAFPTQLYLIIKTLKEVEMLISLEHENVMLLWITVL